MQVSELLDAAEVPTSTAAPPTDVPPTDVPPAAASPATDVPPVADPYSDEALATPEGIARAREALRAEAREHARGKSADFLQLRARVEKAKKRDAEFAERSKQFDSRIAKLTGKPAEVLEALGALTGKDPIEALEAINLAAAGMRPPDDATKALMGRIEKLEKDLTAAREGAEAKKQQEDHTALVERRTKELVALAQRQPMSKLLFESSPGELGERLQKAKYDAFVSGAPITDDQAVAQVEAALAKFATLFGAPGQVTGSESAGKPVAKTLTKSKVASDGRTVTRTGDDAVLDDAEAILELLR